MTKTISPTTKKLTPSLTRTKPPKTERRPRPNAWDTPPQSPVALTLSPLAFLKLTYLCQAATTEVGGFGISRAADALLYVEDVILLKQQTSAVTVELDDEAVADHFERFADVGVPPAQCGRIWVHTHPGSSAEPSTTDE